MPPRKAQAIATAGLSGYARKTVEILLCHCNTIFEHEVVAAIRRGARTVDEVGLACEAGTGCGSCRGAIKTILEEQAQRRRRGEDVPEAVFQLPLLTQLRKPRP